MCAVPLKGLHRDDVSLEQLQALQKLIKKRIPVGAPGRSAARSLFKPALRSACEAAGAGHTGALVDLCCALCACDSCRLMVICFSGTFAFNDKMALASFSYRHATMATRPPL